VWRILNRYGLSRLRQLDPPSGRVIRRYEENVAGELIQVDVKKFRKIPPGGGWRIHGRGNVVHTHKIEWTFLHEAVEDHSPVASAEFLADKTTATSLGFIMRAQHWFAYRGVMTQAVMTDNGKVERFGRAFATEWANTTLGSQTKPEPTTSPAGSTDTITTDT